MQLQVHERSCPKERAHSPSGKVLQSQTAVNGAVKGVSGVSYLQWLLLLDNCCPCKKFGNLGR